MLTNQGVYTITLADSSGVGIPNQAVTVSSANGNTLSASSVITGGNGQATVTVTATKVTNSGNDTLSVTALGLLATQAIAVSSQSFAITTPANQTTKVALSVLQAVTATWTNNGAPVVGQTVTFSTSRGTLSAPSAVTSGTGTATVNVSSTNAGPAVVEASGTGVTAQVQLEFIATDPTQIAVQATPSSVVTQGTSTIAATVRDPANNLVEGATVDFSLTDTTGGMLSAASGTTNQQGQAQVIYTAGNSTSPANGVIVQGTVSGTAVTGQATLTVGGQTVFLSLGTGNKILSNANDTQYTMPFVIQAIDAQGAPVANVPITLTVLPDDYFKGGRSWNGTDWAVAPSAECANEDLNHTGIYELSEDINNNGRLDPGNVASVAPASGVTDSTGTLNVLVSYPADHADYVIETLTVTATVSGTQSTTSSTFLLPALAADVDTQTVGPPGPLSPYGTAAVCSNPN